MAERADPRRVPARERSWWVLTPLVLRRPRRVFWALRADEDEEQERQEPVLALVFLAGIAGVLSTNLAGRILDDFAIDALVLAVWAFVAGGLYGAAALFAVGFLVYAGARAVGAPATYRRSRHVLALASVPLAASLLVWPVRIAVHGDDVFRSGGADSGRGGSAFEALELAFLGWTAVLLVLGLRETFALAWGRALLAAVPALAVPALALGRAYGAF